MGWPQILGCIHIVRWIGLKQNRDKLIMEQTNYNHSAGYFIVLYCHSVALPLPFFNNSLESEKGMGRSRQEGTCLAGCRQAANLPFKWDGVVTFRIHDKTNDKWHNDTDDVNSGRTSRIQTLDLPKDKNSLLEIEIINTSKKDMSFVIIGN